MQLFAVYLYPFTDTFLDYPDNESNAISIYFTGCDNKCVDCSNPELANKNYFKAVHTPVDVLIERIKQHSQRSNTNKLVFIGGDPLYSGNIHVTKEVLRRLKTDFDICIYTGHDLHYVLERKIEGFKFIKCGKYIPELKTLSEKTDEYFQLASTNQEIYNSHLNLLSKSGRINFINSEQTNV